MSGKMEKLKLKCEIGLISGTSIIASSMIGSGIFMSPHSVMENIGSPGASLVIWACSGLLITIASLCYAEMGTVICESGGDYIYILRTTGQPAAFLFIYSNVLVQTSTTLSGIALSFAINIVAPLYEDDPAPEVAVKCLAAAAILTVATMNCLSTRFAIKLNVLILAANIFFLLVIAVGGLPFLVQTCTFNLQHSFEGTNLHINSIGISFFQCLWSFSGWNHLNCVTEELSHPEVNLPRAVMIAMPMVTALYLLVNVSYLAVLTPREIMSSTAVAVTWGNKVLGRWGWLMSVAAALSAFGSLNGSFFSGGRVCFVAAREGHMPDILSMAHVHRLTPSPALIFTTAVSLIVLIPGDFQSIINYFSFTAWFFYGITLSGLLYLKIKKPDLPRPYKVPIILPIVVLLVAVFLVLAPIIDDPQIEYLYVTLFIFSGIIIYVPFIHFKIFPGILNKLTVFLQLFLEVAPAEKNL
ncbi:b(0,+)-type amino acid transporter 1-like isoform X2 [Denticeps clupeoides]|uniref:b(0,+)-type amino acid transporter 1-like isoform X2 n=1 Tax=Denticeps clupeoides TaxID=299321 RepID=UPI0010A3D2EA|nr:b(0,+)-type amino acid transporter 1-like isoform X2 [Denticeps clupeoides]